MRRAIGIVAICALVCGCTSLKITTPTGYQIKRTTLFNNRSEELTLYDPDTGNPLGEYKRIDEERGTEALAVLAATIERLVGQIERYYATGGM